MKQIQQAHEQGMNLTQLAKQFNLDWRTVKKYVSASDQSISSARGKKSHPYLHEIIEMEANGVTVKEIHSHLIQLGFTGAYGATKNTIATIRKQKWANHPLAAIAQCKRSQIANYLWKYESKLTPEQKEWLSYTFKSYPVLKEIHMIIQKFRLAMSSLDYEQFKSWVCQQKQSKQQPRAS